METGKMEPNTANYGHECTKNIQSLQLHISQIMRSSPSVKAIWGLSYTYFRVFWVLGQFWETGTKLTQIMSRDTKRVFQSLLLYISYQIGPYSSVKAILRWSYTFRCLEHFGYSGESGSSVLIVHFDYFDIWGVKFPFHNGSN